MRILLLLLVPLLLLTGCTMATRAATLGEALGYSATANGKQTLLLQDEQNTEIPTDGCAALYYLKAQNEFLKKKLEDCEGEPPSIQPVPTVDVEMPVEIEGMKLKVVPANEEDDKTSAVSFPPPTGPAPIANPIRAACCAPR